MLIFTVVCIGIMLLIVAGLVFAEFFKPQAAFLGARIHKYLEQRINRLIGYEE